MTIDEIRVAAAEKAIIALAAHVSPTDVVQAITLLQMEAAETEAERAVAAAAVQLLEDGLLRFDQLSSGFRVLHR